MNNPVLTLPKVCVEIAGRRLDEIECASLGAIRIQQRLSMPTLCEVTFHDLRRADSSLSSVAAGLSLRVNPAGESTPLFDGEITAFEYGYAAAHGRTLRVRGYDRLHRLRQRQPVRTHVQVGLTQLARDIVQDLGLVVEGPASEVVWRHVIQHGQTDLDLLTQRAAACGCYFLLEGETLRFDTLEGSGDALPLRLGDSLVEARVEVNGDGSCGEVQSVGWDPLRVATFSGRADRARSGRVVSARIPPEWIGAAITRLLLAPAFQDEAQAAALAQAELDRRAAREVTLWGVAEGDPRLRPGSIVEVDGLAPELAGRYVLTQATHLFDHDHGYLTEIDTVPPTPAPPNFGANVMLGVVSRVNDPERLGRVKVSLPACGEQETDWMQVLTIGAGANKGLVALPDVGDHVLVLCLADDPAHGVVLGGVYGERGAPDSGVEGEAVKRYTFATPGGQKVLLDDQHAAVRLQNSSGSFVELKPGRVLIHAATDLRIEAPKRTITIRGKAINFEEAS